MSRWKQADATTIKDPGSETRTQEAIHEYFASNHDIKSPEDPPAAANGGATAESGTTGLSKNDSFVIATRNQLSM